MMRNDSKLDGKLAKKFDDNMEKNRQAMVKSKEAATRMTFALTSMASVALPALAGAIGGESGGKIGAVGSIAMLSTGLFSAGKQLSKATMEFWSLHSVSVATNSPMKNLGLNLKNIFINNSLLITSLGIALPLMIAYSLETERAGRAASDLAEAEQRIATSRSTIENQKTIFEDDAFANAVGIQNYELSELVGNVDLAKGVLKDLDKVYGDLSASQRIAAGSAEDLLHTIIAIQDENATISNKKEWKAALSSLKDEVTGFAGAYEDIALMYSTGAFAFFSDDNEAEDYLTDAGLLSKLVLIEEGAEGAVNSIVAEMEKGRVLTKKEIKAIQELFDDKNITKSFENLNDLVITDTERDQLLGWINDTGEAMDETANAASGYAQEIENLTDTVYNFAGAREELFFGGKYGNVTGSLYKQVISQGVGVLYNKMDIIMSNNFHGFFNEEAAARKIISVLEKYAANGGEVAID